jgi:antitoxin MazE
MIIDIIQIGNSQGIRIPKALLEQYGFKAQAELQINTDGLVLKPVKSNPWQGWQEDAVRASQIPLNETDNAWLDADLNTDETL